MVVLNTDVLKSSLIHSGVSVADAGVVTYAATLALEAEGAEDQNLDAVRVCCSTARACR
jgi:hypothetical protein